LGFTIKILGEKMNLYDSTLHKTVSKILVVALLLVSAIAIFFYIQKSNLEDELVESKSTIMIHEQNIAFLKDQMKMKADSVQIYAIRVKNLQTNLSKVKNQYTLMITKYNLVFDSLKVISDSAKVDTSNKNIIKVDFEGRKKKISYNGSTYYDKTTKKGSYDITIAMDTIKNYIETYLDSSGIIKNRLYADGELISSADANIDSALFLLIKNNGIPEDELGFFDNLRLTLENSNKKYYSNNKNLNINFSIGLEFFFNKEVTIFGRQYLLNNDLNFIEFGVKYAPSIKKVFKALF